MQDLFGQTENRYLFHKPGWTFVVAVRTVGSEFDAIAQTTGVLPHDAIVYTTAENNTIKGKPIIELAEYLEKNQ